MAKKRSRSTAARKGARRATPWRAYLVAGMLLLVVSAVAASQLLWASATPEPAVSDALSAVPLPANGEVLSNAPAGDNSAQTLNLYGGGMRPLVEERDGVQTLNIYGPGGRIIAQVVQDGQGSEEVRYLLTDHLGSTRVVLDAEGNAVARYEYAPHGETTIAGTAAADVVTDPDDHEQLIPMLEQAEDTTGTKAGLTLADAGYYSGTNLEACNCASHKVVIPENRPRAPEHPYHKDRFAYDKVSDSYTCPQGQRLTFARYMQGNKAGVRLYLGSVEVCRVCPAFGVCTKNRTQGRALGVGPHDEVLRNHRKWMLTRWAKTALKRRAPLVEPVFGILKEQMRARRFALRGLVNVSAEWSMLATAFNLRTLWHIWRNQSSAHFFTETAPVTIP